MATAASSGVASMTAPPTLVNYIFVGLTMHRHG